MIRINKGESKLVYFTLKEKSVLDTPYYIFELESIMTNELTLFTGEDTSFNKDRFNSFTFSEGTTSTFSCGFDLPAGDYNYRVYETPHQNSIDTSTASVVELGLLSIIGTVSVPSETIYTDNNTNDFFYKIT